MLSGEPLASAPLTAGRAAASPPEYSWPHGYCDRAALMRMLPERGRGKKCHADMVTHTHIHTKMCNPSSRTQGIYRISHKWFCCCAANQIILNVGTFLNVIISSAKCCGLHVFGFRFFLSNSRPRRSTGRRSHHANSSSTKVPF